MEDNTKPLGEKLAHLQKKENLAKELLKQLKADIANNELSGNKLVPLIKKDDFDHLIGCGG